MRRSLLPAAIVLLVVSAQAQRATEMSIPIGKSPGVSSISSVVGTITSCDQAGGVRLDTDKETHMATLGTDTKIWLDGSVAKRGNSVGALSDCQKGRRAEVKYVYEGSKRTARAEWIKVAMP